MILAVVLLINISALCLFGCTKAIEIQPGTYIAKNLIFEESLLINRIELTIEATELENNLENTNVFEILKKNYILTIVLSISGKEVSAEEIGVMYYTKKLRIAMTANDKIIYLFGTTKQYKESVFLDARQQLEKLAWNPKWLKMKEVKNNGEIT